MGGSLYLPAGRWLFSAENLNIQSVDQYDKESDRIAGQIQIKEAVTGSSVTAAAVAETTETPPLSSGFAG